MLTSLHIKNFKAWVDTGEIRLAPLTVIFGGNSAGKSSIGHLLLALKQTVLSPDRKTALYLGDQNSLIDLGTFKDCLYGHDTGCDLNVSLKWATPKPLVVKNTLNSNEQYRGNQLKLESELRANAMGQPQLQSFCYRLFDVDEEKMHVRHWLDEQEKVQLDCSTMKLVGVRGRKWPLERPEKFYGVASRSLARYQNAYFLDDFTLETERMFDHLYYLGPLREHPRRIYPWAGDSPPDVGQRGEFSIAALLAAKEQGRKINREPNYHYHAFDKFIAAWLVDLGVIHSFKINPVAEGRKEYEVLLRTASGAPEVKLTDVGFGVSQVLPALVQAFYAPSHSIIWMEQPEIHLHPSVQANLADAFICAVKANENGLPRSVQLIVESHSEHFLTRLQRRVAEGVISHEDVAVYFVRHDGKKARIEPLSINLYGEIENWPNHFFGDEMGDIAARTLAAIERRKKGEHGENG